MEQASREKNMVDILQKRAFDSAKQKGWDEPLAEAKTFGDICALFHTEISEAYEDYRNGCGLNEIYFEDSTGRKYSLNEYHDFQREWPAAHLSRESTVEDFPLFKPCGIPIELADEVIRIMHLAEYAGFNLYNMIEMKMRYNTTRAFRHGGKKT